MNLYGKKKKKKQKQKQKHLHPFPVHEKGYYMILLYNITNSMLNSERKRSDSVCGGRVPFFFVGRVTDHGFSSKLLSRPTQCLGLQSYLLRKWDWGGCHEGPNTF